MTELASHTERILEVYVRKSHNARLSFGNFLHFVTRYVERYEHEQPEIGALRTETRQQVASALLELEQAGHAKLERENDRIQLIFYVGYYIKAIEKAYKDVLDDPGRPFPSEDQLGVQIPDSLIQVSEVTQAFVKLLAESSDRVPSVIRMNFPGSIRSVLTLSNLVREDMLQISFRKVRRYLRHERNADYVRSKLLSTFPGRELLVKEQLKEILTLPDKAIATLTQPNDFTFHLWTQISSTVIKDYRQKNELIGEDHGFLQSAYMIGYYAVFFKREVQRGRDKEASFRTIEHQIRKQPYFFEAQQLYAFKDDKGIPLTKKCSRSDIGARLNELMRADDENSLPELYKVKLNDGRELYIHRSNILPLVLQPIPDIAAEARQYFLDTWTELLRENEKTRDMLEDEYFEKALKQFVEDRKPRWMSLLNPGAIYLAGQTEKHPDAGTSVEEILDLKNRRIRPLPDVLGMSRAELLRDARLSLPFWMVVPLVSGLVRFFLRLFTGKGSSKEKRAKEHERAEAHAASIGREGGSGVKYQKEVREVQAEFLDEGRSVEESLKSLAEKWNPLLDAQAKANLVEDVNSLARDFLRRMKTGFRKHPPTAERIREMSSTLSENDAFGEIRRKAYLEQYLALYMLQVLSNASSRRRK